MVKEKYFLLKTKILSITILALIIITAAITPPLVIRKRRVSPIRIESNKDIEKYNFPGEGTEADPYIIENLNIITSELFAIIIYNVTKSFIIRNNYLESLTYTIYLAGPSTENVIISNNTIANSGLGIMIYDVSGCLIEKNTFKNCDGGVAVWLTSDKTKWLECDIVNNRFINIEQGEIILFKINKTTIEGNQCVNERGDENENWFYQGFYLLTVNDITMRDNSLINSGITILNYEPEPYLSHDIENNTVNGKKFGYFTKISNETFDGTEYSQLYFINSTNIEVTSRSNENCSLAINMAFCRNCSIAWSNFTNNGYSGITIIGSEEVFIFENHFERNYYGINVYYSLDIIITNNSFKLCFYGCYIYNSTHELNDNIFIDNEIDTSIID